MGEKTVFLAWQDTAATRRWFPVGRLDFNPQTALYRFGYVFGAKRAKQEAGFEHLPEFPHLDRAYESQEIFPIFHNRVLQPSRPDFKDYLRQLGLENPQPDPMEILAVSGGQRVTDSFEVFPKIEKGTDGSFRCRFFVHGFRYANEYAQKRLETLEKNEPLRVAVEVNNPAEGLAVQIQTTDYHLLGWAPRYLVNDLVGAIAKAPGDCEAHVVRLNPVPAPLKQRLLVELKAQWPDYEPMTSPDYQLLAGAKG